VGVKREAVNGFGLSNGMISALPDVDFELMPFAVGIADKIYTWR
jgi:hypothetical protein